MNISSKSVAAAAATVLIAGAAATNAQAAEKEWNVEVMPYLWAASIKGDMNVRGQAIDVDAKFSDMFEMLEIGGGMHLRAERSQWVLWMQVDYLAMNTDKLDNPPEHARLDSNTTMFTGGVGRNFGKPGGRSSVDVLVGVRYFELDNKLRFDTLGTFTGKRKLTDPGIMLRPSFQLSERWRLNPTFALSVGGDSESAYELQPQLEFRISEHKALRFGYRRLHYETENASNGNTFDGDFQGLIIGLSGTFGGT